MSKIKYPDNHYHWFVEGCDPIEEAQRKAETRANYVFNTIKTRLDKANKKQEQINDLTYEKELIIGNVIDCIKEDLNESAYNLFRYCNSHVLREAWFYFNHQHDDESVFCISQSGKSLKKEYEGAFNFVTAVINKNILFEDPDFVLTGVTDFNFSSSYEFEYSYKDKKLRIGIPAFPNANDKIICPCYQDIMSAIKSLNIAGA